MLIGYPNRLKNYKKRIADVEKRKVEDCLFQEIVLQCQSVDHRCDQWYDASDTNVDCNGYVRRIFIVCSC